MQQMNDIAEAASSSRKKSKKGEKNEELNHILVPTLKKHSFRYFRFITDVDGETRYLESIMDNIKLPNMTGAGNLVKITRQNFARQHGQHCVKLLNDLRNYTQSNIQGKCKKYMDSLGEPTLPPLGDLLACVKRTLDLDDEDNINTAIWWVDQLMPSFTGTSKLFNHEIRYYATISEAKSTESQVGPDITADVEAFGYVVVENNYKRWCKVWELDKDLTPKERSKKMTIMQKKKAGHKKKDGHRYYYCDEHPELNTKYTNPNSGQEQFGGWTNPGLDRFANIRNYLRQRRTQQDAKEWEEKLLEILREEHGIEADNHEAQMKLKGKKAKSKEAPKPVISAARLFGDDIADDDVFDIDLVPDKPAAK